MQQKATLTHCGTPAAVSPRSFASVSTGYGMIRDWSRLVVFGGREAVTCVQRIHYDITDPVKWESEVSTGREVA